MSKSALLFMLASGDPRVWMASVSPNATPILGGGVSAVNLLLPSVCDVVSPANGRCSVMRLTLLLHPDGIQSSFRCTPSMSLVRRKLVSRRLPPPRSRSPRATYSLKRLVG